MENTFKNVALQISYSIPVDQLKFFPYGVMLILSLLS